MAVMKLGIMGGKEEHVLNHSKDFKKSTRREKNDSVMHSKKFRLLFRVGKQWLVNVKCLQGMMNV